MINLLLKMIRKFKQKKIIGKLFFQCHFFILHEIESREILVSLQLDQFSIHINQSGISASRSTNAMTDSLPMDGVDRDIASYAPIT